MTAAARGAAESGRVKEVKVDRNSTFEFSSADVDMSYNAAITQSSEQLTRYFEDKEV